MDILMIAVRTPGILAQDDLIDDLISVVACLDAPASEFGDWQDVEGYDIWVGYPVGFDIPTDWYWLPDEYFFTSKGERYMWIVASHSIPGTIYVFPFKSMEPYADANSNHYGVHPCGAYRVTDYPPRLLIDLED